MQGLCLTVTAVILLALSSPAFAVDERAAKGLLKDNDCTKCHSVSREKEGPSFQATAKKHKDKPDAKEKLATHLTTSPIVKVEGKEEKHKNIEAVDPAELNNVIEYILSQ